MNFLATGFWDRYIAGPIDNWEKPRYIISVGLEVLLIHDV